MFTPVTLISSGETFHPGALSLAQHEKLYTGAIACAHQEDLPCSSKAWLA